MTLYIPESCASHNSSPVCAADAIQAVLEAGRISGSAVIFPAIHWDRSYYISKPIVISAGCEVRGESVPRCVIKATADFAGAAMILSHTWTGGDWWHYGNLNTLILDCANVAPVGVAIYQMGEESTLRRVRSVRYRETGIWLTGAHAPANIELCRTDAGQWQATNPNQSQVGLRIGRHPTFSGNSGIVNINGFSGDDNAVHVRIEGAQTVILNGLKSERSPVAIQFGPEGGGSLVVTGGANCEGGTAFIDSQTANLALTLIGCMTPGYPLLLRMPNPLWNVRATGRVSLFTLGEHFSGSGLILGGPLAARNPWNQDVKTIQQWTSDGKLRITAPDSGGVVIYDKNGNVKFPIGT